MKYSAVFFDAGNTLLRPYPSVRHVCAEVFRRNGFHAGEDDLRRAVAAGDRYYELRYWRDDTFWRSETEAKALWVELYALVAAELGINGDRHRLAHEIYNEFGYHHRWELFPDVLPVLEALKSRGVKIGIVSNWDTRLSGICTQLGLSYFLDFVVSSAAVGYLKPQHQIFNMALQRAGESAERVMHVGDHYYADVLGARSAGITPVLIDRDGATNSIDCERVDDLRLLLDLIE